MSLFNKRQAKKGMGECPSSSDAPVYSRKWTLLWKITDENWGWQDKQNPSGHNDDNSDLNLWFYLSKNEVGYFQIRLYIGGTINYQIMRV